MIDRRRATSATLALAALLAVSQLQGCAGAGPESAGARNTVRAYLSADPASMSLIGKTDANAEELAVQITDSLVQYDAELRLRPRLAVSWEFSPDRLTLTFVLRDGVRWHDGRPLTAKDVVFTVNRLLEPEQENRVWAPLFKDLESVEAPDARTVVARYTLATPGVIEGWRVPILPAHVAGDDEDLYNGRFAGHPIGCGPFRFVRHDRGRQIVLEANDDYWDGRPGVDRLIYKIYPDQRTAFQALLTGEMDLMPVSSNIWAEAEESDRAEHLERLLYYRFKLWTVIWNQDGSNPFFVDARVRRAMVLALDREQFVESVLEGLGRPGVTTYAPDPTWAHPEIGPAPFDPAAAARLLDDAGWIDSDGDGTRDRDGKEFAFRLTIPASPQKLTDHMAAWQQQSWAEIGVRAEIVKLEWQAFREQRNSFAFEAVAFTLQMTPNPDQYDLYHSASRGAGYNFAGLADPDVDRLLEEGRRTFDDPQRREIYHRLQLRLEELEPVTCLFQFASPLLYDRRLEGVVASPIGYAITSDGPRLWRWADGAGRS